MKSLRRVGIVVGLVLVALWLFGRGRDQPVEPGSLLTLEISGRYVEAPESPVLERLLGSGRQPFMSLLSELEKARRDERLSAVILRIGSLGVSWGKAAEIREAIQALSSTGRRVVALLDLETFGANLEYYVASAAPEVYAAPGNHSPVVGLAGEYLFLGGLFERLGLEVYVERIGRFKTAGETFGSSQMSAANREMMESILDSINAQFIGGIASSRGLTEQKVRSAIDEAPFDSDRMIALGLLDGVHYLDDLQDEIDPDAPRLDGADYASVALGSVGFAPETSFALIYGTGNVVLGNGSASTLGSPVMASETLSEALIDAAESDQIAAVILRIDSPGGSPLAADRIWHAVERVKAAGKPVIASFSDVAASAGYYAATGADAILSGPGTLTGSIGVLVLRPVLGGAFEKLDIGFESMTRGRHADLQLAARLPSEESLANLRAQVALHYKRFVSRVAEGRPLDYEQVDAVAQGRVWTGSQAAELKLVDEVGGIRAAFRRAKQELGLDETTDVAIIPFPPPKSLSFQILEMLESRIATAHALPFEAELRRLEPWLQAAADAVPTALLPFSIEIR